MVQIDDAALVSLHRRVHYRRQGVSRYAAQGYGVRPYGDFGLKGKLIKATIPLTESKAFHYGRSLCRQLAFAVCWAIR